MPPLEFADSSDITSYVDACPSPLQTVVTGCPFFMGGSGRFCDEWGCIPGPASVGSTQGHGDFEQMTGWSQLVTFGAGPYETQTQTGDGIMNSDAGKVDTLWIDRLYYPVCGREL